MYQPLAATDIPEADICQPARRWTHYARSGPIAFLETSWRLWSEILRGGALIDQGVAVAMAEAEASRVRNGYNNNGSGPRPAQAVRESLAIVIHLVKLNLRLALYKTMLLHGGMPMLRDTTSPLKHPHMTVPWATLKKMMTERIQSDVDKIEKYIGGFPDMILGSVKASKPKTMQEAIEFTNELMDEKTHAYAERQAEKKRNSSHLGSSEFFVKKEDGSFPSRVECLLKDQPKVRLSLTEEFEKDTSILLQNSLRPVINFKRSPILCQAAPRRRSSLRGVDKQEALSPIKAEIMCIALNPNLLRNPLRSECEVKRLKQSRIPLVKVRWNSKRGPEFHVGTQGSILEEIPTPFRKDRAIVKCRILSLEDKAHLTGGGLIAPPCFRVIDIVNKSAMYLLVL
ncbi:hypothetical protein Tco_1546539 [Tanacetum coccineum]